MRERLLAAFLLLTLLTVLLYGVPRALVRAGVVSEQAQLEVTRDAAWAAAVVRTRLEGGLPVTPAALEPVGSGLGDQLVYLAPDGTEVVLAGPADLSYGTSTLTSSVDVPGGGTVESRRARSAVRADVVRELRPILLSGLAAMAVAVLSAVVLSRRLSRPFQQLAEQATAIGHGDGSAAVPHQRVREAEAIAAALRASGARVASTLRRERQFARNASHQLRTPLTGIRLRVEDVASWSETPTTVREELAEVLSEVDRLGDTVTALLALAREEGMGASEEVGLRRTVYSAVQRWAVVAVDGGRQVEADVPVDARVRLPVSAVDQVLDVLVHNALVHGRGRVVVRAAHDGRQLEVLVRDEGRLELVDSAVFVRRRGPATGAGEGIGLALAAEFATALGGRLEVAERAPTTFRLVLPSAPVE